MISRRLNSLARFLFVPDIGITDKEYFTGFANRKSFGSLDGLRAIAILAVVWHHTMRVPDWKIATRGFLGVELFFVISGFLIMTIMLREQRRTGSISLHKFYIRRFLRIFPPYYLMLFVIGTVAFFNPAGATSEAVKRDLPYALLYLTNFVTVNGLLAITWSLSAEEQFYIVVPTVAKYARRALPFLLLIAYILVSLPLFGFFPALRLTAFFREVTFGPILLGVILAYVLDDPRGFWCVSRLAGWRFAPFVTLGLVFAAASYPAGELSGWPRLAVHWAMLALVASCIVREENLLAPLLSPWPMQRIGVVSYGIYLYHELTMHFVGKVTGTTQGVVMFAGTALATWAVAEVSYRLFESRFLSLKARYVSQTAADNRSVIG